MSENGDKEYGRHQMAHSSSCSNMSSMGHISSNEESLAIDKKSQSESLETQNLNYSADISKAASSN